MNEKSSGIDLTLKIRKMHATKNFRDRCTEVGMMRMECGANTALWLSK
jgi:hypothetical protein